MKRIVLVRHWEEPGDDRAQTTLEADGHAITTAMPFKGETIDLSAVDGAVIYGGPFNVFDTDKHPFLDDEAALIEHCLENDLPLLGICQGAQQIAWHLGADVGPVESGIREFGYFEITPTAEAGDFLDRALFLPQNHFHTFALPEGAVHLASSEIPQSGVPDRREDLRAAIPCRAGSGRLSALAGTARRALRNARRAGPGRTGQADGSSPRGTACLVQRLRDETFRLKSGPTPSAQALPGRCGRHIPYSRRHRCGCLRVSAPARGWTARPGNGGHARR